MLSFIYEFVGARFTILAFIGLFNIAAIQMEYIGQMLAAGIAVFLYYIISDAFSIFWTGINLEYLITHDSIIYRWGVKNSHELVIPLKDITAISIDDKKKRRAVVFDNVSNIKNGDYGFAKEIHSKQLSFENIENLEPLIEVLDTVQQLQIGKLTDPPHLDWTEKLPHSRWYVKSLQLYAFLLLYLSTSIVLKLIDHNVLDHTYVVDLVVDQRRQKVFDKAAYTYLDTELGYSLRLAGSHDYLDEEIEFYATDLYKDVIYFGSYKGLRGNPLVDRWTGMSLLFRLASLLSMLIAACYIFYKRANIPLTDLSVLIGLPVFFSLIAFLLFR